MAKRANRVCRKNPPLGKRGDLERVGRTVSIGRARTNGQRITVVSHEDGPKVAAMTALFDGSVFPKPKRKAQTVRELNKETGDFEDRELEPDEVMELVPARRELRASGRWVRGRRYSTVVKSPRTRRVPLGNVIPGEEVDGKPVRVTMEDVAEPYRPKSKRLGRKPKGATRYGVR